MLNGKTIVVGVTGGIAAYKSCDVVSKLRKLGAIVYVITTKNACEFISPISLQTLSNNFVIGDMFDSPKTWEVEHIEIAKKADLFLVVPATANIIGKIACGIADDMLTTTIMATKSKVVFAPAMNTNMYNNPIFKNNMENLKKLGYSFIDPKEGLLACGDIGNGKLVDVDDIIDYVKSYFEYEYKLSCKQDLKGVKILITAGPTIEAIDPVRYITNRSSGKMGYSIAEMALRRGADVTLISGKTKISKPKGLSKYVDIESADELYTSVIEEFSKNDVIIQSAAVADYKPKSYSDNKIKKSDDDLVIELSRNKDIAYEIGKIKGDKILIGFAAETNDITTNALKKIKKKNLDFIVANDLKKADAGFAVDTNIIKIIDSQGKVYDYPKMLKTEVGNIILDKMVEILKSKS